MIQISTGAVPLSGLAPVDISLDSGAGPGRWNRWSYRAGPRVLYLRCDGLTQRAVLHSAGGLVRQWEDPLAALKWMASLCRERPQAGPPFKGGWIGYLSYDLGRLFEELPARGRDDLTFPLFEFTFHSEVSARSRSQCLQVRCDADVPGEALQAAANYGAVQRPIGSNFTRESYEAAVRRAIEYIGAGDIFQVNLSHRFSTGLRECPSTIYQRLHDRAPAAFGAYLGYGTHALLCNSPELFLRVEPATDGRRRILTRPIKGTRPKQRGMRRALLNSIKDQAELNMIVDLERNDLGRICEIGSVRVTEPRAIEAHPTVYHGVATVEGSLRADVEFVDILRATFPGGSITGAPKIRAMQIIDELEPTRRGPYCGAIGYLSVDGHMEFNIAIRTMIVTAGLVHMPVGGGIVADSVPSEEYDETLVKARAMFAALGVGQ